MTAEDGATNLPNISMTERRKRLQGGTIMFVIGMIILLITIVTAVNRWWRLALFPLFAGAASGYFQWREHT